MELQLVLLRFLLTFGFSFAFGLERQKAHKPVGFGTYAFVSSGACALSIAAVTLNKENPFSLLAAIVTGIGFLGAGALIKTSDKIGTRSAQLDERPVGINRSALFQRMKATAVGNIPR